MFSAFAYLKQALTGAALKEANEPIETDMDAQTAVSQGFVDEPQQNNQEIVEEVYDLIKDIKDPEREQTLEDLNVVQENLVKVKEIGDENYAISIEFVPTIPHCSLATLIGLCMKVKLERELPFRHKLEIFITPGSHETADEINKQINDKERVAAAMENPGVMEIVETCLDYGER